MSSVRKENISIQRMGPQGVGLKDLAQKSGYSMSTVSKALNGSDEISQQTKKKIAALAMHYNYVPNKNACALRKQKTDLIMVCLPKFELKQYYAILEGIMEVAMADGYQIVVNQFGADDIAAMYGGTQQNKNVDGMVLLFASGDAMPEEMMELHEEWDLPTIKFRGAQGTLQNEAKDRLLGNEICRSLINGMTNRTKVPHSFSRV